jgi:hypothetical protein
MSRAQNRIDIGSLMKTREEGKESLRRRKEEVKEKGEEEGYK